MPAIRRNASDGFRGFRRAGKNLTVPVDLAVRKDRHILVSKLLLPGISGVVG